MPPIAIGALLLAAWEWTPLAGGILAAVAAIAVSLYGAKRANDRLERQLLHDRHMRDRDELRAMLDEAAQHISRATRAMHGMTDRVGIGGADKLQAERARTAVAEIVEIDADTRRLELRLIPSHPIVAAHRQISKALRSWSETVVSLSGEATVGNVQGRTRATLSNIEPLVEAFHEAARLELDWRAAAS